MLRALQYYDSLTPQSLHTYQLSISSLLIPVLFACTQDKGLSWLHVNWYAVISYVQIFEEHGLLHFHVRNSETL